MKVPPTESQLEDDLYRDVARCAGDLLHAQIRVNTTPGSEARVKERDEAKRRFRAALYAARLD